MMQTLTIPSYSSPGTSDGFFSSLTKGTLEVCSGEVTVSGMQSTTVNFQFNPEDISITREINWTTSDSRNANSTQNYSGSTGDSISFMLMYDATEGGDWDTAAIQAEVDTLVNLTRAAAQKADTDGGRTRPPYVKFALNAIKFVGGIDGLTIKYLMLDAEGNPMRLTVDLSLKGIAFGDDPKPLYNASKTANDTTVDASA